MNLLGVIAAQEGWRDNLIYDLKCDWATDEERREIEFSIDQLNKSIIALKTILENCEVALGCSIPR